MNVVVVDHGQATRCGIRDLGIRIAERLGATHADCDSPGDYQYLTETADAVIVNYRADLMPWWRPTSRPELAILHNYGPDTMNARAAELLGAGFDRVLVLDDATPADTRVHAVGRPLPPAPSLFADDPPRKPRVGSFGFAFPHKGFGDVAAEVATVPGATYALHMPEAHFNGAGGAPVFTDGILDDIRSRLNGNQLVHTTEELSPGELVDRLAGNTVNCLLYAPGQPDAGLSSALDYLIAAGRPILVSEAAMFAAAGKCAAIWPNKHLDDVLDDLNHWEHEAKFLWFATDGKFRSNMLKVLETL